MMYSQSITCYHTHYSDVDFLNHSIKIKYHVLFTNLVKDLVNEKLEISDYTIPLYYTIKQLNEYLKGIKPDIKVLDIYNLFSPFVPKWIAVMHRNTKIFIQSLISSEQVCVMIILILVGANGFI